MTKSFAPEIRAVGERKFIRGGSRFATRKEAQGFLDHLSSPYSWMRTRVTPSTDPPNNKWRGRH